MKYVNTVALCLTLLAGCVSVDYVGEEKAPTDHVDVYYSEDDVVREFRIIGRAHAESADYLSFSKMQAKLVATAKEKGADGIIVADLGKITIDDVDGSSTKEKTVEAAFIEYLE